MSLGEKVDVRPPPGNKSEHTVCEAESGPENAAKPKTLVTIFVKSVAKGMIYSFYEIFKSLLPKQEKEDEDQKESTDSGLNSGANL